jgi:glycosyltransferase involved in cell wall biosynthesis
MRLLFVKHTLAWPRVSGHDVHAFHMMQALAAGGHDVVLATAVEPVPDAIRDLGLARHVVLPVARPNENGHQTLPLTKLQERFRSYWGIPGIWLTALRQLSDTLNPDAVIAVGLNGLPFLPGHRGVKIWYAADEWIVHHLSLARVMNNESWEHVRAAAIKGAYERAFASSIDRVWVVSTPEARAMRWLAGYRHVDIVPNGVDSNYFAPATTSTSCSAVFWGRLDFEPNVQGLQWFGREVWPHVRREVPQAAFIIVGFNPGRAVRDLAAMDGVTLVADVPDLREEVGRHSVVALPFVSGGGIKNKLLEAASMGKPIVTTRRGCGGLDLPPVPPLVVVDTPEQWQTTLRDLWANPARRADLGASARRWVVERHTWTAAADRAIAGIEQSMSARRQ